MAGYWLKLYTEILDDPKYFRLSDSAKLGMVELMIVAKRLDMDGEVTSIEDVAFYTRRTVEWWTPVFEELSKIEYLVSNGSETIIRKFAERQAAVDGAERIKQFRALKHKQEFMSRDSNEPVTIRNGDSDSDSDSEKIKELPEKKSGKSAPIKETKPSKNNELETRLINKFTDITGIKMMPTEYSKNQKLWYQAVRHMLFQVDGDIDEALSLLEFAIKKMDKAPLDYYNPNSVLSTFIAVTGKEKKK